jgi:Ankyrin repeats (3 copies)
VRTLNYEQTVESKKEKLMVFGFLGRPSLAEITEFNRLLATGKITREEVDAFLKRKPNLNRLDSNGGATLNCAFTGSGDNEAILEILINHGINLNLRDQDGTMAIHEACRSRCWCSPKIIRLLLSKDATIRARDEFGSLPLNLAGAKAERNHRDEIVRILEDWGP